MVARAYAEGASAHTRTAVAHACAGPHRRRWCMRNAASACARATVAAAAVAAAAAAAASPAAWMRVGASGWRPLPSHLQQTTFCDSRRKASCCVFGIWYLLRPPPQVLLLQRPLQGLLLWQQL